MSIFDSMKDVPERKEERSPAQIEDEFRSEVLQDVYQGLMTPADAEAACVANSYRPLQRLPATYDVNIDTAAMWTPEMVAIWFATKGDGKSLHRHLHTSYEGTNWWRPNHWDSRLAGEDAKGFRLVNHQRTHLGHSFVDFDGRRKDFPSITTWYPRLQRYLVTGEITASGYRLAEDDPIQESIDAVYWANAEFGRYETETVLRDGTRKQYVRVRFPAAEVLRIQKPAYDYLAKPQKLTEDEQTVFEALVKEFPQGFPRCGRQERNRLILRAVGDNLPRRWRSKARGLEAERAAAALERRLDRLFVKFTGKATS
jgi:hypothetical protein